MIGTRAKVSTHGIVFREVIPRTNEVNSLGRWRRAPTSVSAPFCISRECKAYTRNVISVVEAVMLMNELGDADEATCPCTREKLSVLSLTMIRAVKSTTMSEK